MKEISGNLFDYPVICIPTNGVVNKDNKLVMGRGIALTAKTLYPNLDTLLGYAVKEYGNISNWIYYPDKIIISFPTKHHWKNDSDINLIEESVKSLVKMTNLKQVTNVYLPRIGCGNGNLKWSVVKPVLQKYLDDRFIVVNNKY